MNFSRREILRLGTATLALAPWSRAADDGAFEFIVANDTHYIDDACRPFHERIAAAMRASAPQAVFLGLAGDIADRGETAALTAMREIYTLENRPLAPVPGNHDHISDTDRSGYDAVFPGRLNYGFGHAGWQFLALDTTQGVGFSETEISAATLGWLDATIPHLDPRKPTFAFTHFPLADGAEYRPLNAGALLSRLRKLNLRWVHCGHLHAEKTAPFASATLSISRCCARLRGNRDGSPLKGWHVYRAWPDGSLTRRFVSVPA